MDELKPFGFELSWLHLHLEPIFAMKEYVRKLLEVEKLEEKVFKIQVRLDVQKQFLESMGSEMPHMDTILYDLCY